VFNYTWLVQCTNGLEVYLKQKIEKKKFFNFVTSNSNNINDVIDINCISDRSSLGVITTSSPQSNNFISSALSNFIKSSNFITSIPFNVGPNITQSFVLPPSSTLPFPFNVSFPSSGYSPSHSSRPCSIPPSSSYQLPIIMDEVKQFYNDLCWFNHESNQ
jgi:hypothetical protein